MFLHIPALPIPQHKLTTQYVSSKRAHCLLWLHLEGHQYIGLSWDNLECVYVRVCVGRMGGGLEGGSQNNTLKGVFKVVQNEVIVDRTKMQKSSVGTLAVSPA